MQLDEKRIAQTACGHSLLSMHNCANGTTSKNKESCEHSKTIKPIKMPLSLKKKSTTVLVKPNEADKSSKKTKCLPLILIHVCLETEKHLCCSHTRDWADFFQSKSLEALDGFFFAGTLHHQATLLVGTQCILPPPPFFSFRYPFCLLFKIAMYIMRTMPFFPCLGSLWIYSKLTVTGAWLAGSPLKWGAGKANEATLQAHVCTHAHTHMHTHTHTLRQMMLHQEPPQVFCCILEPRVLSLPLFASREVISPFQGFSTSSWRGLRP